jgi:hypothetical protein
MAVEFDMKERYFEDLFFQGGVRMVHQQQNLNPYNAFKNAKAEENREGMCHNRTGFSGLTF